MSLPSHRERFILTPSGIFSALVWALRGLASGRGKCRTLHQQRVTEIAATQQQQQRRLMSAGAVVSIYDYGSLKPSTDLPTSLTPSLHFVTMLQKSILPAPPLPTALGTVTLLCVCMFATLHRNFRTNTLWPRRRHGDLTGLCLLFYSSAAVCCSFRLNWLCGAAKACSAAVRKRQRSTYSPFASPQQNWTGWRM